MNVRSHALSIITFFVLALGYTASSHAIGDITCETPEDISGGGTVIVTAGLYSGPIAVTVSEDGGGIEMVQIENPDPGAWLDDCVAGAITSPSTIGSTASSQ